MKAAQWKPGQTGNPGGRPKGSVSLTTLLKRELRKNDGQLAEMVVKVALREAASGEFRYTKEIWDRVDGTLVNRVRIEDAIENMLTVAERVLDQGQYAKLVVALAETSGATSLDCASGD